MSSKHGISVTSDFTLTTLLEVLILLADMSTKLLLVRHGETAWNRQKIFRGTYDIPLNDNGRKQAELTARTLKNRAIQAVYTSPLSRARETAEIVCRPHSITPEVLDSLMDLDCGEWTGREAGEVERLWPHDYQAWMQKPHTIRPPGGTTLKEIFDISFGAMEDLAVKHEGQVIALFSHRVVNKLLLLGALALGLERFPFIIQGNCCINEIERIQEGYLIRSLNDVSHIKMAGTDLLKIDF